MDLSEVDEYSRTSGTTSSLPADPLSLPENDNCLLPDNSNNIDIHDVPTSSNLGMFFN